MPYCQKCGVELEERARVCPLCGTPVEGHEATESTGDGKTAAPPDGSVGSEGSEGPARRPSLLFMEAMSVVAGIVAILCLGIDLWSSRGSGVGVSWSLFVIVGLAMAWLPVAMPIVLRKKPWLILAVLAPGELLFIFLLNVLTVTISRSPSWWILSYGLPIYLLSIILLTAILVLSLISKTKGLNVAGIVLAAGALECLGIEAVLTLASGRGFSLEWSPIVALACLPASGLAFYFHYRIVKKPLHRTFRI